MIKSPLRPAMTQPLTSPYDLITRYFRENNGVADYYQLLEPVDLTGDFEIEAECFISDLEFAPIFGGAQFGLRTDADGLLRFILPRTDLSLSPRYAPVGGHIVAAGKLNTFTARKSGNDFYVGLNGVEVSNTFSDIDASISFLYVAAVDVPNQGTPSARLFGGVTRLKTWVNGDRNTGDLIHNFKFDEPNSVYQRNHAVAQGINLIPENSLASGAGWSTSVLTFADALIFDGENNFASASYSTSDIKYGTYYRVDFELFDYVSGNFEVVLTDTTSDYIQGNGKKSIYLKTAASGIQRVILRCRNGIGEGNFKVKNLVIREFHGCEVVGGMPEDWFQVERQPHWNYWLGPELGFVASVLNAGWSFDGIAYTYSGDVFTFLGDTGRFEIGKSYLVEFTAVVNAGQLLVRQSTSGSNVFDTTVSGDFKVVITVVDGSTDNVYFCSAFFDGARFAGSVFVNSIREKLEIAQ